jgi:hypothetical protein
LLEILPKSQGFFSRLSFSQNLQNQTKEGRTKADAPTVQKKIEYPIYGMTSVYHKKQNREDLFTTFLFPA